MCVYVCRARVPNIVRQWSIARTKIVGALLVRSWQYSVLSKSVRLSSVWFSQLLNEFTLATEAQCN